MLVLHTFCSFDLFCFFIILFVPRVVIGNEIGTDNHEAYVMADLVMSMGPCRSRMWLRHL